MVLTTLNLKNIAGTHQDYVQYKPASPYRDSAPESDEAGTMLDEQFLISIRLIFHNDKH